MKAEASPNIAFVKYWGKLPSRSDTNRNLAVNPSISMTLSKAKTTTTVEKKKEGLTEVVINGKNANASDLEKITLHLKRVCRYFDFPEYTAFKVASKNNFPQGTGLASSASAYAALTLAAVGEILGQKDAVEFQRECSADLSRLARRGSGSACRSVRGGYMKWSSDFADSLDIKWQLRDTIIIFSRVHKPVPSSQGHTLALSSPLFSERLEKIPDRVRRVEEALRSQDLQALGAVIEPEALELHKIASTANPPVDYLLPETRKLLKELQAMNNRDFFFTLDAGPNVHIISERDVTQQMIDMLNGLGLSAEVWLDETGAGPQILG